jgi:CheY-like chemotaxis protein
VFADRGQFEQVIINLAINARDAMPQGGILTISARNAPDDRSAEYVNVRADRRVILSVSDTGTGIPVAIRERIFEPFFTTKEEGKGTGLGLSMVYGIVKQSGGTIDFETAGTGTTFLITLPAASETASPGVIPETVDDDARGTETVLLVEDDADVRTLTRRMLEERGYTVLPARDSVEALQLLESARIDVLLTDMVMPHVSGPELAEQVVRRRPATVVVFMSGYADDSLMSMGMSIGSAFVRKPFTLSTLARAMRDAIDGSRKGGHASAAT